MESSEEKISNGYNKRPFWHWIIIYLIIGGIIYSGIYFFIISKKSVNNYNPISQSQQTTTVTPLVSKEITIQGNEFAFDPSTITVNKNETVAITFKNTGKFPHNFAIPDLNIQTKIIQSGQQDTIQFTPQNSGQFAFLCTVSGHADKGMKGILAVQ